MDLSALTTATQTIGQTGLVLVTPNVNKGYQAQNAPNVDSTPSTAQMPPTFLFDYEGENTITLTSDITDHYLEDNTSVQDQIALKPETVTVQGFIGELNDIAPTTILKNLQTVANKLTIINAYTPVISQTALIAFNEAAFLYANEQTVVNAAAAAWNSAGGNASSITGGALGASLQTQNKQQLAYLSFYQYWKARTLFTIQTPWLIFQNMAIQTLRAVQDPETRVITEFDITFKQMKFATILPPLFGSFTGGAGQLQWASNDARNGPVSAPNVNVGPNTPTPSASTLTAGIASSTA